MDLIVLSAVVVVLTVVVYLLATLGTKETPFEEALAEQRQKRDMENAQTKPEKQHKKPKVKKVKSKKDDADTRPAVSAPKTTDTEVESEPLTTITPPPSPPAHQPNTQPSPQANQKKDKKKPDEAPRKIPIEEVSVKVIKAEPMKTQAAPPPTSDTTNVSKDKREPKKDAKNPGKDAKKEANQPKEPAKKEGSQPKEFKKEANNPKESKKEANPLKDAKKEVNQPKEAKKDAKEAKKENIPPKDSKKDANAPKEAPKKDSNLPKDAKKEVRDPKKNTNDIKKDDKKEVVKDAKKEQPKEQRKEPKKDLKEVNKDTKEAKKEVKEVKEVKKDVKETKTEPKKLVVQTPISNHDAVEASVDKKKKKDKPKNGVNSTLSESKLLPMVQGAPLSGNEIQTLIDVLLNKQQQNTAGGDWVKKGRVDPITQLKRQLDEVENRLREKDEAHSALSLKITDLCSEVHSERSRASKLKAQLEDITSTHARQQEIAANNAKAQQTSRINEVRKTLEQEYNAKLQQQKQINEQLQNATSDTEVAALRAQLAEAEVQAKMTLQEHQDINKRCQQYEEHIRVLEEKRVSEENARAAQLKEMQAQMQKSDTERTQALADLAAMEREQENMSGQVASSNAKQAQLQHNLQEKLREKTEVDSRLIQVESELCSVRQVILDQTTQIERLKEEKESLASQSVRPAAEGQENGDVHSENTHAPDTAHLQSLVKEKDILIEERVSEVATLNKEIARLKEDFLGQRQKNDEATGVVEEEKTKVRAVLRRIFPEVVVDDALDQGAFLSEFESKALQAATQTQQVEPQIVEKVVEVIKVVEKEVKVEDPALKTRVEELDKENAQLRTQVADLEKNASSSDDSQRVSELEEEVRTVTEKVTHYQTVLADTENLLKSLQASVESEEAGWSIKLSEKDGDMKQLVADKANLELQVKTLEDTLDKVKKAEDMQEQLEGMKDQLQKEEKEKMSLLEKLQQAQEQLTNTATQGGTVGGGDDELRNDNDKLRALVTVGQDENREQEKVIDQLQKELAATKVVSTNGPASEDQIQEGAGASQ